MQKKNNVSQFYEQEPKEVQEKVNIEALKQKTINELNKFEEELNTGVYLPEKEEKESNYSIEEKENISK
jgi:hypothetical protein